MTEATRLITPPEGTPFLAIRDEYIAICGNACRAALLSFFEGMTLFRQRKGWQDAEWVYVRLRELPALLRGIWGESTIKLEMKWLRERDFLRTRARLSANAPNEYYFNVAAVQAAVDGWAQAPSALVADDPPASPPHPARQSPETSAFGAENQRVSRIQPTGEVNLTSALGENNPPKPLDSLKDSFLESGGEKSSSSSSLEVAPDGANPDEDDDLQPTPTPVQVSVSTEPTPYALYAEEIGELTPMIGERLKDAVKDFGEEAVRAAIRAASLHGARHWAYVSACLDGLRGQPPRGQGYKISPEYAAFVRT